MYTEVKEVRGQLVSFTMVFMEFVSKKVNDSRIDYLKGCLLSLQEESIDHNIFPRNNMLLFDFGAGVKYTIEGLMMNLNDKETFVETYDFIRMAVKNDYLSIYYVSI